MEIISKISKGSKMDQIYLPRNRVGFPIGSYVKIVPVVKPKRAAFFYYGVKDIEPLKISIITEIISLIEKYTQPENIIITGSFLEDGFTFNDIDVLLITEEKEIKNLQRILEEKVKMKIHLFFMTNNTFNKKRTIDPILALMLSKCITTARLPPIKKRELNYKLLDMLLLPCETFPLNYEQYSGKEKYYYLRSLFTIAAFIDGDKISKEELDKGIEDFFTVTVEDIKQNLIEDKQAFIKKFKSMYSRTFNKIMEIIPCHDTKQK